MSRADDVKIRVFTDGEPEWRTPFEVGLVRGVLAVTKETPTQQWTVTHLPSGFCFTGAIERAGFSSITKTQAAAVLRAIEKIADWTTVDVAAPNAWLKKQPGLKDKSVAAIRSAIGGAS